MYERCAVRSDRGTTSRGSQRTMPVDETRGALFDGHLRRVVRKADTRKTVAEELGHGDEAACACDARKQGEGRGARRADCEAQGRVEGASQERTPGCSRRLARSAGEGRRKRALVSQGFEGKKAHRLNRASGHSHDRGRWSPRRIGTADANAMGKGYAGRVFSIRERPAGVISRSSRRRAKRVSHWRPCAALTFVSQDRTHARRRVVRFGAHRSRAARAHAPSRGRAEGDAHEDVRRRARVQRCEQCRRGAALRKDQRAVVAVEAEASDRLAAGFAVDRGGATGRGPRATSRRTALGARASSSHRAGPSPDET